MWDGKGLSIPRYPMVDYLIRGVLWNNGGSEICRDGRAGEDCDPMSGPFIPISL